MAFEIRVNGELFTLWETATVQRSIDTNCGVFRFTSTNKSPADYPVKTGDAIQIVVDGQPIITGFVDVINASGSKAQGMSIRVEGRDNVQDLIDSSVPDGAKSIQTPISIQAMCGEVIAALGLEIEVIFDAGSITALTGEITADSGKKCMDFLTDFARKKQVYLVTNGQGDLIVFRPRGEISGTKLIQERNGTRNNIISFSKNIDDSGRFFTYRAASQDNFGADDNADYSADGVDRKGESEDDQIRETRYLEFQTEETMNDDEIEDRAKEEQNIRTARRFEYSVDVVGASQNDGFLWDIGLLVSVNDTVANVVGTYLIRAVSMSVDLNSGTITTLTLARPEAYTVRQTTQQDKRIAPIEGQFQNAKPDESVVFVRKKKVAETELERLERLTQ